ncbi:MAG: trans-aconitate 2-methyltransferase [Haloarculaceae archaeon]
MADNDGAGSDANRWDAADYDDDHAFVYEYGADLLDLLSPEPDDRVLDLGCGTGHLSAEIADRGATVLGIDQSAEMVAQARQAHPDLDFARADARSFAVEPAFDAVFSNAALHWIPDEDQDAAIATVRDVLRPGGRLIAELGGTGNVGRIVAATQAELGERGEAVEHPWYFPSVGEYATRLEAAGLEVRFARLFDRPTELDGPDGLANWLGMFGDSLFAALDDDERAAAIAGIEERLRPELYDPATETWTADYRRLRVLAVRTEE